jgi:hypothetical protein
MNKHTQTTQPANAQVTQKQLKEKLLHLSEEGVSNNN